jgi:sugar lactone lactonase YvrE
MPLATWLRTLAFAARSVAGRTRRQPPRPRSPVRQHLLLEALEDRVVPSAAPDFLYVGDAANNTVQSFDATSGAHQGTPVPSGSGGLTGPTGVLLDHHGNLLVVNQNVNLPINGDILRSAGGTVNQVVSPSDPHAPFAPRGMVLGSDDTLYVADMLASDNISDGRIEEYQYNENTGTATFKAEIDHPAGFSGQFHPRALVFGPDGLLYVSIRNIPQATGGDVLRFDPTTGAFVDVFVASNSKNDLQRPEGRVFGPDGNLYVTSFQKNKGDTDKIDIFAGPQSSRPADFLGAIDLDRGNQPRAFAQALLFGPEGRLFVPITGSGPDTGEVRRYDVTTGHFDVFVPSSALGGALGQPLYLTFGNTDPATLAYNAPDDSAALNPVVTALAQPPGTPVVSTASPTLSGGPQAGGVAPSGVSTPSVAVTTDAVMPAASASPTGASDLLFAAWAEDVLTDALRDQPAGS